MHKLNGGGISPHLLVSLGCLFASACGQTGDLYLPENDPDSSAPVITIPEELSDETEDKAQEETEQAQ